MDVLDAVYGFIVYVNDKGVVTGGMAESLTSTDAVTWTLKLRKDMKFTDGAPYDAEAVKYNWDRAADPATLSLSAAVHLFLEQGDHRRRSTDADDQAVLPERQFRSPGRRAVPLHRLAKQH